MGQDVSYKYDSGQYELELVLNLPDTIIVYLSYKLSSELIRSYKGYIQYSSLSQDIKKQMKSITDLFNHIKSPDNRHVNHEFGFLTTVIRHQKKNIQSTVKLKVLEQKNQTHEHHLDLIKKVYKIQKYLKEREFDHLQDKPQNSQVIYKRKSINAEEIFKSEKIKSQKQHLQRQRKIEIQTISEKQNQKSIVIEKLRKKLLKNYEEISSMNLQIQNLIQNRLTENQIEEIIRNKSEKYQEAFQIIEDNYERAFSLHKTINIETKYINKFKFFGKSVQYVGQDNYTTQILTKKVIQPLKTYLFKCRIKSTKNSYIYVGVVDKKKQKRSRCSFNSGNAVCLNGKNGNIYCGKSQKDQEQKQYETIKGNIGFYTNSVITVQVHLTIGQISWTLENGQSFLVTSQILKDKNRKFVPYIQFFNTGDIVELWDQ